MTLTIHLSRALSSGPTISSSRPRQTLHASPQTRTLDPSLEILVNVGADEAIFSSISAFVNPGEEVVILEPAYDVYVSTVLSCSAVPVFVPLRPVS